MTDSSAGLLAPYDVIAALKIEGYSYSEAAEITSLTRKVAALADNETLIRVRDLKKDHIGKLLQVGENDPRWLHDIEEPRNVVRSMQTAYSRIQRAEFDNEEFADVEVTSPLRRGGTVTVVLDSKLAHLPSTWLVKLTDAD